MVRQPCVFRTVRFLKVSLCVAGSARASLVFDLAINDGDVDVRNTAVAVMEQLLGDGALISMALFVTY